MQKTTTCIGLQAEQILSVNIYTYFFNFGRDFDGSFFMLFLKAPASCGKKNWNNFSSILKPFPCSPPRCLIFAYGVFTVIVSYFHHMRDGIIYLPYFRHFIDCSSFKVFIQEFLVRNHMSPKKLLHTFPITNYNKIQFTFNFISFINTILNSNIFKT